MPTQQELDVLFAEAVNQSVGDLGDGPFYMDDGTELMVSEMTPQQRYTAMHLATRGKVRVDVCSKLQEQYGITTDLDKGDGDLYDRLMGLAG